MAQRIYTVHRRGADELELSKEGFCWPAFFIAPLWFAWHRDGWGLLAWLAAGLALGVAAGLLLAPPLQAAVGVGFAFAVAVGANDWRRWRLERAGWRLTDVVAAPTPGEAEEKLAAEGRLTAPPRPAPPPAAPWPRPGADPLEPFLP